MKEDDYLLRNAASCHEDKSPAMLLSPAEESELMQRHDRLPSPAEEPERMLAHDTDVGRVSSAEDDDIDSSSSEDPEPGTQSSSDVRPTP